MSLQNASNLFSKCIQTNVSALASLSGFSTQIGNSSRGYIRDFWKKPTAMPTPGHLHKSKTLDGHNKRLYIKVPGKGGNGKGNKSWRPSYYRTLTKSGYDTKMKYKTGREFIMWNMIRGKSKYAEYF